jgi:tyrosyl-tRNA synthetase
MVRKESERSRLESREQGISFTEFSYMLLQAWDFVQLFDRFDCRLQMGGSDQWGNITEGVDLIRRRRESQAFGLTSPLVTKADGTKFGKTESGNVWLDGRRTSPYQFFQYWINTSDAEVGAYLRYFTFLPQAEILALDEATAAHPEQRQAQRVLAREVTTLVHGSVEAQRAERAASVLFTAEIGSLDLETLTTALTDADTTEVPASELAAGLPLVDALVRTGLASSKGEARRLLDGGGISVNNHRESADRALEMTDALHGRFVILRRGQRAQHVLVISGG